MTRWVPLAVMVAVGLASACAGGDDGDIPAGTSTTRSSAATTTADRDTTTTSATASADAEIIARYEAFWDARFAANQDPVNPDHPGLREYATGVQLENVIDETEGNRDDGVAFRRPPNSVHDRRVTVIAVDGDVARLQDCATTDGVVYRINDGSVVDDSVVTHSLEATMRLVDGEWKLASTRLLQEWEGVAGCALAE